ncbi:MAG TPA: hypothetical protein PLO62_15685 [Candidatus Hydrogenedentes bacterium]|nr:hypothetical protein [Candidatus Hydrogenedentota bacterium]
MMSKRDAIVMVAWAMVPILTLILFVTAAAIRAGVSTQGKEGESRLFDPAAPETSSHESATPASTADGAPSRATPEELVAQAMRSSTVEGRIAALRAQLAIPANRHAASRLNSALAEQYLALEPPALPAAAAAIDEADRTAQTSEERQFAGLARVKLLEAQGSLVQARDLIGTITWDHPEWTLASVWLRLEYARLCETAGNLPEAETAYRAAATQATSLLIEGESPAALDVYRLACSRLLRLYRKQNRALDAEQLLESATNVLGSPLAPEMS